MISNLLFVLSNMIMMITTITIITLSSTLIRNSAEVIVLLALLLVINISLYLLSLKPSILNYPMAINDLNKAIAYKRVKILLSGLSLFISILFSVLVFQKINQIDFQIAGWAIVSYIIIFSLLPFFVIRSFIK